jgi:hypothetical protein
VNSIRYPGVRVQVLSAVEALADREYQERVWIRHELPHPKYYDELKLEVHILFDDTEVCTDPMSCVGEVIHPDEVEPLRELGVIFDALLTELGDVTDAEYLAHPRWAELVRLAGVAWTVMQAHET